MLYGAPILAGVLLGRQFGELASLFVHPGNEAYFHRMIVVAVVVYILVMAPPFMPGAEIGVPPYAPIWITEMIRRREETRGP